jgi:hypothetical protein
MIDLALWGLAIALALYAAWLTLPRPVELDWERLFKLALVSALRGPLEAQDAQPEAWLELGRSRVWYHPASRMLAAKLADPSSVELPVPALPGERALLDRLQAAPAQERVKLVFGQGADELLYDDPLLLGERWDLARLLGPGAGWQDLAEDKPSLAEVLRRRTDQQLWVLVGEGLDLAPRLRELLGEAVLSVDEAQPEALVEALQEPLSELSSRLVFLVQGAGAITVVQAMHGHPGLRDKVLAVVGVGADLGPHQGWLAEHFDHEQLDTEIHRATPWFHLAFLEEEGLPAGSGGLALEHTVWPQKPTPKTGRQIIEAVDLGVLPGPALDYPPELLATGLAIVVTARISN